MRSAWLVNVVRVFTVVAAAVVVVAAQTDKSPIVRGAEVTFVATGDPSDPPRIVGDFNGWQGSAMTPAAGGRRYTLRVTLDPAARIEYLIAYRDRFTLDPGNSRTVPAPEGPPRSELRMPRYRPPAALPPPRARGTVEDVRFESRGGERRRVRVYRPAGRSGALPVLYVHDGDIFASALGLPSMLDSLIDSARMAPALVVFIDAVDRHADYEPGSAFRDVFTREIVPLIEGRYAVRPGRRVLMGLSRSTVGALDTCINGTLAFEACALIAPAVPAAQLSALPRDKPGARFLIESGTYDIPLVTGARALRRALEARHAAVAYFESPQGHNHTAFRSRLPAVMTALFPPGGRF
jgi:enterochelin esterase-like enzyme